MAAPTRNLFLAVTGSTGTTSFVPSLTTIASGSAVGDHVFLFLAIDGNPTVTLATATKQAGWEILGQLADGTGAVRGVLLAYRVHTAGTVPNPTITISVSEAVSAQAIRVRASSGKDICRITATSASGSSADPDPAAIANPSASAQDIYYMTFYAADAVTVSTAAPTNYGNHQTGTISTAANGTTVGSADRSVTGVAAAASENPAVFTKTTEQWVTFTIAVYESNPRTRLNQVNKTSSAEILEDGKRLQNSTGGGFAAVVRSDTSKTSGRWQVDVVFNAGPAASEAGRIGFVDSTFVNGGTTYIPGSTVNDGAIAANWADGNRFVSNEGASAIDLAQGAPTNGSWPPGSPAASTRYSYIWDGDARKFFVYENGNTYGNGSGVTMNPANGNGGISPSFTDPVYFVASMSRSSDFTVDFNPTTLYGGAQAWDATSISGTASIPFGALGGSASGATDVAGLSNGAFGSLGTTATATVDGVGSSFTAFDVLGTAGSGAIDVAGASSAAFGAFGTSAAGEVHDPETLGQHNGSFGALGTAATAAVNDNGQSNVGFAAMGTFADAAVLARASSATAFGAILGSAAGMVDIKVNSAGEFGALGTFATGTAPPSGFSSFTSFGALGTSASAKVDVRAAASAAFGPLGGSASGAVPVFGLGSGAFGALASAATGKIDVRSSAATSFGALGTAGSITTMVGSPISGTSSVGFGPMLGSASAFIPIGAISNGAFGALGGNGQATVQLRGDSSQAFGALGTEGFVHGGEIADLKLRIAA